MSKGNRYRCYPVSSPCQISEEVRLPCLQLPWPLARISQAHRVGTHFPLCRDISLTPATLLVLLHVGVSAAEDDREKVLAEKID